MLLIFQICSLIIKTFFSAFRRGTFRSMQTDIANEYMDEKARSELASKITSFPRGSEVCSYIVLLDDDIFQPLDRMFGVHIYINFQGSALFCSLFI